MVGTDASSTLETFLWWASEEVGLAGRNDCCGKCIYGTYDDQTHSNSSEIEETKRRNEREGETDEQNNK